MTYTLTSSSHGTTSSPNGKYAATTNSSKPTSYCCSYSGPGCAATAPGSVMLLPIFDLGLLTSPAPRNPLLRCIRFFACWECRPIGTIIAATAFATATVFTYQALKLAIWTATKDYIEHCQSVVVSDPQNFICYWDRIIDSSKGLEPSNYKMHSSS